MENVRVSQASLRYTLVVACLATLVGAGAARAERPYFERTGPPDADGAIIMIHGGGWTMAGEEAVTNLRWRAGLLDDRWTVLNVDHRPGSDGFRDVLAFHDHLREERGPDFPICAWGASSGGHFALMLAARRELACAISNSGPTELATVGHALMPFVQRAFGYDEATYARWSPALHTDDIGGRPILLAYESGDPLVAPQQAHAFAVRAPQTQLYELSADPAGDQFVHTTVDPAVQAGYFSAERTFVAAAFSGWRAARETRTRRRR